MNRLRRMAGLIWMITGPAAIILLLVTAIRNIDAGGTGDIHRPLPWIIIIGIFAPVAIGLTIFGWYSWKGEYDYDR